MYLNKIADLEKQLAELKTKQAKLDVMEPAVSLAFQLHEITCTWNHTDGCGWHYEKDEDYKKSGTTRNSWYKKAQALLKVEPDVSKIIQLFQISRSV